MNKQRERDGLWVLAILFVAGCAPAPEAPSLIDYGFLKPRVIGAALEGEPWITSLEIVDLDGDGLLDVVACEGRLHKVVWLRQVKLGRYAEQDIGAPIQGPVHIEPIDFDNDGDIDLLVASMGVVLPNPSEIGSVILMEQTDAGTFVNHVLLEGVARVADVRAGDLDNDGDYDLVVGQFGYHQGEIRWMRNDGDGVFKSEILFRLSGTVNAPIADFDGDGNLDFAALVSQEWEEVHLFKGDGKGGFGSRSIYGSSNEDFGSSGLSLCDLDGDGDQDILFSNGDEFDYKDLPPRVWHGVQWLENDGLGGFRYHRVGNQPGCYSPVGVDIDGDGDMDIVAVSCYNSHASPEASSLVCFENRGDQRFEARPLAGKPTHWVVVRAADMDGDGDVELVTGAFNVFPPFENSARIVLWER